MLASVGSIMLNSVISWPFVPTSTRTPSAFPAAIASSGGCGSEVAVDDRLEAAGRHPSGETAACDIAASMISLRRERAQRIDVARLHAEPLDEAVCERPRRVSRVAHHDDAPLCGIARVEQAACRQAGRAACRPSAPPADSPKIVTLFGSPPKLAIESRTHSSAATWSRMPRLPDPSNCVAERVGEVQEAERPEPVVDRDDDDVAVRHELGAVVPRRVARAEDERAAVDPEHHRPLGVVARRCPHVEVEAVFADLRLLGRRT